MLVIFSCLNIILKPGWPHYWITDNYINSLDYNSNAYKLFSNKPNTRLIKNTLVNLYSFNTVPRKDSFSIMFRPTIVIIYAGVHCGECWYMDVDEVVLSNVFIGHEASEVSIVFKLFLHNIFLLLWYTST